MTIFDQLKSSLVVSCQAPVSSPLNEPFIISAMARACINQGAKGVRIDTPSHIMAVRQSLPDTPIIGLWKKTGLDSPIYITPRCQEAEAVAMAGADIVAIDATDRLRTWGETLRDIITFIHNKLGKLVMADIDTIENAISAQQLGADFIGTTLYGYTEKTRGLIPPNFEFIAELVKTVDKPVICEGGIKTPTEAKKALQLGCFCVVVGTAITGVDLLTQQFVKAINS
ncbi:MAG: N-acetylmannosamine-6-phosphate 2-epimerase [Geminocystis sp.]|nr:N-acetylmannosamine-6-phosphate 2-epimerase [Geminocystis sp.]HIK36436.1 N-acetylmannosamine-6-phosphate 2-epimerase [Geminocystis sp. M7585_C2015_104]MCS7149012.1 N-acetylmannosamine-6-phosphate 2-epimerase [Geminocystis sp.]MCX8077348.1 N-acetylmannosamine-6-phosphate 2-epimerase [Geminocystis sp.]MDW8114829.1 N-acetylmannosamine-6-phosphate 2-epimerase [Geminocystis sp.]